MNFLLTPLREHHYLAKYHPVKRRKIIKLLTKEGFCLDRSSGDHDQYIHICYKGKKRLVTIPYEDEFSIKGDILPSIINQMGLTKSQFYKMIDKL